MNGINLLSGPEKEQARRYVTAVKTVKLIVVIFFVWVQLILVAYLATWLMQSAIYRNSDELNAPTALQAELLHRKADEIRKDKERIERYFIGENLDIAFLGIIARAAEGITIASVELDSRQRIILVEGIANNSDIIAFSGRLSQENVFSEVNVSALERRGAAYYFLLELVVHSV